MEKFLEIEDAILGVGSQLISLNGIKTITTPGPTDVAVVISYFDGTATTVTTAAQVGGDVYKAIKDGAKSALQTSWTKPYYSLKLPKAITSIVNA